LNFMILYEIWKYEFISTARRFYISIRNVTAQQLIITVISISILYYFLTISANSEREAESIRYMVNYINFDTYLESVVAVVLLLYILWPAIFPTISNLNSASKTIVDMIAQRRRNILIYLHISTILSPTNATFLIIIGWTISAVFDLSKLCFVSFLILLWIFSSQLSVIAISIRGSKYIKLFRLLMVILVVSPLSLTIITIPTIMNWMPPFALLNILMGSMMLTDIYEILIINILLFVSFGLLIKTFDTLDDSYKELNSMMNMTSLYKQMGFMRIILDDPTYVLITKEILQIWREKSQKMSDYLTIIIIWVIAVWIIVFDIADGFSTSLGILIVMAWVPFKISENSLSRERDSLWILKISRVSPKNVVLAKFISTYVISFIYSTLLVVFLIAIILHIKSYIDMQIVIASYLFGMLTMILASSYGMLLSFTFPSYNQDVTGVSYEAKIGSFHSILELSSMFIILVPVIILYGLVMEIKILWIPLIAMILIIYKLSCDYCRNKYVGWREIPYT